MSECPLMRVPELQEDLIVTPVAELPSFLFH
jgi:hypothetical protein